MKPGRLRRLLRVLAILAGSILGLVTVAFAVAWWTTTPPDGFADEPLPPPFVLEAPAGPVLVGASAVDITPIVSGLFLAGFNQDRRATGVHDPLFARAIAFQRGDARVVLVVLDLIGFQNHHVELVRERVARSGRISPEAVLVLSTHDHSAPDTLGLWGPHPLSSGVDAAFIHQVLDGAAKAAERALAELRPARLTLTRAEAPPTGVSRNKRDPAIIDRELTILAADDATDGKPIATAVVFACHPEVLFGGNTLITADFPGVLLREVEQKRGGTGIFFNGPLGGMVTPDTREHSFTEMERVGRTLADLVIGALPKGTPLIEADLAWVRQRILVPIQNRRFIAGRKLGILDRPFEGKGYVWSEVDAFRLGPLLLATVPGEALPRVGFDVKEKLDSPFSAVVGLGADELGYLIPEEAFADPRRYAYEKTVSPGPLATTLVRERAVEAAAMARRSRGR